MAHTEPCSLSPKGFPKPSVTTVTDTFWKTEKRATRNSVRGGKRVLKTRYLVLRWWPQWAARPVRGRNRLRPIWWIRIVCTGLTVVSCSTWWLRRWWRQAIGTPTWAYAISCSIVCRPDWRATRSAWPTWTLLRSLWLRSAGWATLQAMHRHINTCKQSEINKNDSTK